MFHLIQKRYGFGANIYRFVFFKYWTGTTTISVACRTPFQMFVYKKTLFTIFEKHVSDGYHFDFYSSNKKEKHLPAKKKITIWSI